jgi:Spy/CpxP family protein refolding chaperone
MRKLALSIIATAFLVVGCWAQDPKPDPQTAPQEDRPNLLQQLGLAPDQLRQIRQLNQQRKPMVDEAQRRVREANQALDAAIYADSVDENDVKARLNELQQAQSEVARIRFTNELAIRRILTPEQLGRFRELRRQFAEQNREMLQERRQQQRIDQGRSPAGTQNQNKNLRQMIREQNQQNRKLKSTPPAQAQPRPKN